MQRDGDNNKEGRSGKTRNKRKFVNSFFDVKIRFFCLDPRPIAFEVRFSFQV